MVKNSMNESIVTFCRRPRNPVDSGHLKFEQLILNNCTAFIYGAFIKARSVLETGDNFGENFEAK